MSLDAHKHLVSDFPVENVKVENAEKTDSKCKESDFPTSVKEYSYKKALIDEAALNTKNSVLDRYGGLIGEDQKVRINEEISPDKYEIYNRRYFIETKLSGVPYERRDSIIGFHEVESHEVALRDSDDPDELLHVTTHETMHSLSFQKSLYEQKNGTWSDIETLDFEQQKVRSGVREITYRNDKVDKDHSERIRVQDANLGLNEGMTELYTLRELLRRGEEPGLSAYTEQVNWAAQLEQCVGEDTMAKAYFGGALDELGNKVDELLGSSGSWDQLSFMIDRYGKLSIVTEESRQERKRCGHEIDETLRKLYRRSRGTI